MARSLLYQDNPPNIVPPGCGACDRREARFGIRKNGKIYNFVIRDKVAVEDLYLIAVKAAAYAIAQNTPYTAVPAPRAVKDHLIKLDVVI